MVDIYEPTNDLDNPGVPNDLVLSCCGLLIEFLLDILFLLGFTIEFLVDWIGFSIEFLDDWVWFTNDPFEAELGFTNDLLEVVLEAPRVFFKFDGYCVVEK